MHMQALVEFKVGPTWLALQRSRCRAQLAEERDIQQHSLTMRNNFLLLSHWGVGATGMLSALEAQTADDVQTFHADVLKSCTVVGLVTGAISKDDAIQIGRSGPLCC